VHALVLVVNSAIKRKKIIMAIKLMMPLSMYQQKRERERERAFHGGL
jgi:hypothetical protein